jgi:cation-transporting ATPase E
MVVIITLFFSYGATYLYRRNVLLQEDNAMEKIGRIKNLCMDKTGTLTDNKLVFEGWRPAPDVTGPYAEASVAAYVKSSGDGSETAHAMTQVFKAGYSGDIIGSRAFSSSRQFGAVHVKDSLGERVVLAGAPDVFMPLFQKNGDIAWAQNSIDQDAKIGKRLICFVQSDRNELPNGLSGIRLSPVAMLVFHNNLREGVSEAIRLFETRGVAIRIISGDGPETVQAVAVAAGVKNANAAVTGAELETWSAEDFKNRARDYAIFARVKPEQKEKIIESLKRDGFTAMVGDGANDALAIKKADLGIAMFDGAPATRQVASVVLVKNSFTDLPNGVALADGIIQNIEICASIFFNQMFLGLFFFISLAVAGYAFPFTPLNLTFMNYFTIGLPGALILYWIVRPASAKIVRDEKSFLRRVIPFALVSAVPQALVAIFAFYGSLQNVKNNVPSSLVVLIFIVLGVIFFMFTPSVYRGPTTGTERKQFLALAAVETVSFIFLIKLPLVERFYNLKIPSITGVMAFLPLVALYGLIQYGLVRWFFEMQVPDSIRTETVR